MWSGTRVRTVGRSLVGWSVSPIISITPFDVWSCVPMIVVLHHTAGMRGGPVAGQRGGPADVAHHVQPELRGHVEEAPRRVGRGLHSSTFRLKVSTLCGYIVWSLTVPVTRTAQVELRGGRVSAPARGLRRACSSASWRTIAIGQDPAIIQNRPDGFGLTVSLAERSYVRI